MSCLSLTGTDLQLCRAAEAAESAAAAASSLQKQHSIIDSLKIASDAIFPLIITAIIVVICIKIWPTLNEILKTRRFMVKFGGFEITVQDAAEQLKKQVEDLQTQMALLAKPAHAAAASGDDEPPRTLPPTDRRRLLKPALLWVDDKPSNNALMIDTFRGIDIDVDLAISTEEAIEKISADPDRYFVVLSDLGREEGGKPEPLAGVLLVKSMRQRNFGQPVAIITTMNGVRRGQPALDAGAEVLTNSPTVLTQFVVRHLEKLHADQLHP